MGNGEMATTDPLDDYLAALLDPPSPTPPTRKAWHDDPVLFARECVEFPLGAELTAYQADVLGHLVKDRRVAQRGPHGLGKDLAVETPLPTPTGWTTMGAVKAGDTLIDEQGKPCTVLYAEEPQWREAYEVRFADGASVIAGAGHLWTAIDVYHRPKIREGGRRRTDPVSDWRECWDAARTRETHEIASTLRTAGGQLRWRVPTCKPVECSDADLPIDPYLLGYWLGDGASASGRIYVGQTDAVETISRLGTVSSIAADPHSGCLTVRVEGLTTALKQLGVLGAKRIPMSYLRSSVEQRRALVQGLWDSDGYRQDVGCDEITLTNKALAPDVAELLRSLGLTVRVRESDSKIYGRVVGRRWRIAARFDFNPYRLTRYDWHQRATQSSRFTQRTIVSADPVGLRLTKCIAVDSASHLFLAGEDFIPTHNTAAAAILVHWFSLSREEAGIDWKVVTTSGAWRQLIRYLWPEIRLWANRLRWDAIGREPYDRHTELLTLNLNLKHGSAFAVASSDPALIEGAHAQEILYIFDEAKSIVADVFDAAEGAFSVGEAYALASSTPGDPSGRFYDIHQRKRGYEDWWTRHVTKAEVVAAGRMNPEWAAQRAVQWGPDSAMYANRVEGEFHSSDTDAVIPLSWVEAATERWYAWYDSGDPSGPLTDLGVDVAREGADQTVLAFRHGDLISELRYTSREDTMKTTGRAMAALGTSGARPVVDVVGVGGGVVDRLREQGIVVDAFSAGSSTDLKDRSRATGFVNCRSAAWWTLRERLDPAYGSQVALPDDDLLIGDLVSPKYEYTSTGKIKVESKDDIRKRIGRSTDAADAVVQAFWPFQRKRGPRIIVYK